MVYGLVAPVQLAVVSRTLDVHLGRALAAVLPILLIPQVLFTSPAIHMDMKGPAGQVAHAMPTWWAYDLLRRLGVADGAPFRPIVGSRNPTKNLARVEAAFGARLRG